MSPEVAEELSAQVAQRGFEKGLERGIQQGIENSSGSNWNLSVPIKATLSRVRLLDPRVFLGGGGLLLIGAMIFYGKNVATPRDLDKKREFLSTELQNKLAESEQVITSAISTEVSGICLELQRKVEENNQILALWKQNAELYGDAEKQKFAEVSNKLLTVAEKLEQITNAVHNNPDLFGTLRQSNQQRSSDLAGAGAPGAGQLALTWHNNGSN